MVMRVNESIWVEYSFSTGFKEFRSRGVVEDFFEVCIIVRDTPIIVEDARAQDLKFTMKFSLEASLEI
jgi:hypothetical protein